MQEQSWLKTAFSVGPALLLFVLVVLEWHALAALLALVCVVGYGLAIRTSGSLQAWVLPGLGMASVALGAQLMFFGGEGIRVVAAQSGLMGHLLVLLPALGLLLLVAPVILSVNLGSRGYGAQAVLASLPLVFFVAHLLSGFGLDQLAMTPISPVVRLTALLLMGVVGLGALPIIVLQARGPARPSVLVISGLALEAAALVLSMAVLADGFTGRHMAQVGLIHAGAVGLLAGAAVLLWASARGEASSTV